MSTNNSPHFQIRDPIHGVIFISHQERLVIDSRVFQRLRNIKQVGFADFAFPCATHSRYSHSLGAMCVATKIFDRVFIDAELGDGELKRLRGTLRLAALLHDIGHAPLSHTTESLMPSAKELWGDQASERQATHEDFTLKLIIDSPLTTIIDEHFGEMGIRPAHVASLLTESLDNSFFRFGETDYGPILRQIISSELDCDRMDYLMRDSFFCGVNYGKFDSDWLIDNLIAVEKNNKKYLGFKARAIFAFEDFLLSRYHMFASVYLHHTPVVMEKMMARFFSECPKAFTLPSTIDDYLSIDDLDLWMALRKSENPWAKRIVERRPYVMVDERFSGQDAGTDFSGRHHEMAQALHGAGVEVITACSKSVLSNYFGKTKEPIFVEDVQGKSEPLESFTPLFVRYSAPAELFRIYVDITHKEDAQKIIKQFS